MKKILFATFLYLVTAMTVWAQSPTVENPYVRAMPPGQKVTGAFMILQNPTDKDRALIRAASDVAGVVELHTHVNENGVMKMRPVKQIDVKANSKTDLKPGGLHVMLIDLKRELKAGDKVNIDLFFDDNSKQTITAPVKKIAMGMGMKHGGMGGMHGKMSGGKMQMMKHANPMPNLMQVVVKQVDKLNLTDKQSSALKAWRDQNNDKAQSMVKQINQIDAQINAKALAGANVEELEQLAKKVMDTRMALFKGKLACRENMKNILDEEQYNQVITMYKAMMMKK